MSDQITKICPLRSAHVDVLCSAHCAWYVDIAGCVLLEVLQFSAQLMEIKAGFDELDHTLKDLLPDIDYNLSGLNDSLSDIAETLKDQLPDIDYDLSEIGDTMKDIAANG